MRGGYAIGVMLLVTGCEPPSPSTDLDNAIANVQAYADNVAAQADTASAPGWSYTNETDPMTDKAVKMACVVSSNEVQLNPPYGDVKAELCLRNSPQYGRDAFVSLQGEGQILCRSYEPCSLKVRFDKEAARNFSGGGASDGSSNVVFFRDRASLERGIKSADETIVQIEFYEAGNQAVRFPTKGFDWK